MAVPDRAIGRRRWRLPALSALGFVVAVLVLCQLLLPRLAEQRVRDRIKPYGSVRSVAVHAFPAIELLWGHVDSLSVDTGPLVFALPTLGGVIADASQVATIDLRAPETRLTNTGLAPSGLLVHDVVFHKSQNSVRSSGTITQTDFRAGLPSGLDILPVASGGGEVEVRASGSFFGVHASVDGLLRAQDGRLVLQPAAALLAGLATVTLYSDPHLAIEGIGVRIAPDGYTFTVNGRLL